MLNKFEMHKKITERVKSFWNTFKKNDKFGMHKKITQRVKSF